MTGLTIRDYVPADAPELAQVYFEAVQHGAAGHYDARQRQAWCCEPPSGALWSDRLGNGITLVAETDTRLIGFMTLATDNDLLDLAFVRPDTMGTGVADALYAVLEGRARAAGIAALRTDASLLAERFFLRRGWQLVARQEVERDGIRIPNARMRKPLATLAAIPA